MAGTRHHKPTVVTRYQFLTERKRASERAGTAAQREYVSDG